MKGFPLMATSECSLPLLLGNNTLPLGQQLLPGCEFNMNFPFMPLSMSSKLMNVFTSLHFYPAFPSRSSENLYDSPQFLPKICIAKYFIKSEIYVFMSSKTHNCRATLKAPILLIPSSLLYCGKVNCQPEWGQWEIHVIYSYLYVSTIWHTGTYFQVSTHGLARTLEQWEWMNYFFPCPAKLVPEVAVAGSILFCRELCVCSRSRVCASMDLNLCFPCLFTGIWLHNHLGEGGEGGSPRVKKIKWCTPIENYGLCKVLVLISERNPWAYFHKYS